MMPVLVIVILVLGGVGGLALDLWRRFTFYTSLLIEFRNHRTAWIEDGKPSSWYSPLPGNEGLSSQIAASWAGFSWLFFSPGWVDGSHLDVAQNSRSRSCTGCAATSVFASSGKMRFSRLRSLRSLRSG
jgi:hypothetical protein